jgi:hypothetical protein
MQGLHPIQNTTSENNNSKPESLKAASPTLFNLYTSDLPRPPQGTTLTTYADDKNPAASHQNYPVAEQTLHTYLDDIFNWTKNNDLIQNPDKCTATLFTAYTHEHNVTLNLKNKQYTHTHGQNPKILGL